MGNDSIDLSLANIWNSWFKFKQGKKRTKELEYFQYYLEKNLYALYIDINDGNYQHGSYFKFVVTDNKRREISVAGIRDRIVHRLVYEYLIAIFDKSFIYDVWSCRQGKGLIAAIERAQKFAKKYQNGYVWRADIKKFFDNVNQEILLEILSRKVFDSKVRTLLREIIQSYQIASNQERERERES